MAESECEAGCGLTRFHPPKLWGLDFHFNTFNKLYIADILKMQPYPMFPGAFAYGNHPVYKVDVLGVVVRKDEKAKVFIYAVDDGTGVISCCCWKQPFSRNDQQSSETATTSLTQLPAGLHARMNMMMVEEKRKAEGYELGDLLHIRGKLKTFRSMMEIVASYHRRVDNPSTQIARMVELPLLYRQCYDKPFVLPYKVARELKRAEAGKNDSSGEMNKEEVMCELGKKIEKTLECQRLREFSVSNLLDVSEISDLASQLGAECDTTSVVQRVLRRLEEDRGTVVCRRHATPQYENVSADCPLDQVIISLLQRECVKPKYVEKGCHYMHLLDELHRTVEYSTLQKTALLHVLERLETNSDVIRVSDRCYYPV